MNDKVLVAVSSILDGSMSAGVSDKERRGNRTKFLQSQGISTDRTILVNLEYNGTDYCRYFTVSSDIAGDGMISPATVVADALFTTEKSLSLFLPIADCIAAVLYDPIRQVIGLSHLGRHNLMQGGGTRSVEYMQSEFATDPSDLLVWLSPSVGRETYPLYDLGNRSLAEVALDQLRNVGIATSNIQIDQRDTAKESLLFSHSEFLKGNRSNDGRQAVVAMMRP